MKKKKSSSYFFGEGEIREKNLKRVKPYSSPISDQDVNNMYFDNSCKKDFYENNKVLTELNSILVSMLLDCRERENKSLVLTEEDLTLLCEIGLKKSSLL